MPRFLVKVSRCKPALTGENVRPAGGLRLKTVGSIPTASQKKYLFKFEHMRRTEPMAKKKPRWAVVYERSRTGWASFCVRGSNRFEARQNAEKDARLKRFTRFYVRPL